jgi:DMSO/TMAO reductase YedYZ molybdopterin-dependent catalytic subunit
LAPIAIREVPYNAETAPEALHAALTPVESAYVRTNFGVPEMPRDYTLLVEGAVRTPLTLSLSELAAMPQESRTATMECAGNDRLGMRPIPPGEPWGHGAVATNVWSGVPLRAVLERAGAASDAQWVIAHAADAGAREDADDTVSFARAIPFGVATDSAPLIALQMNAAPLTPEHGAPARLVVPGWYGMANGKWVLRLEVSHVPFEGYFQTRRYVYRVGGRDTPVDRMRVKSFVASPSRVSLGDGTAVVRGWAWSGFGAVTHVDVSVDGHDRWESATLGAPPSPWAWTPWSFVLPLRQRARLVLRSRARDAVGNVQPDVAVWNALGYGNNAIRHHLLEVT